MRDQIRRQRVTHQGSESRTGTRSLCSAVTPLHTSLSLGLHPAHQLPSCVNLDKALDPSEPVSPSANGKTTPALRGGRVDRADSREAPSAPLAPRHILTGEGDTQKGGMACGAAHLTTIGVLHHEAQAVVGLEGVLQRLWGREGARALPTLLDTATPARHGSWAAGV